MNAPHHWLVPAIIAITACLSSANAVSFAERPSYLLFQLDNDLFTGSDRDYTSGVRIAWLQPISGDSLNTLQRRLRDLGGTGNYPFFQRLNAFIDPEGVEYDWGVGITQKMFTPEDPDATIVPAGQRPYAGWLGVELSLHAKDPRALSTVTLSIGTTGKQALARQTQNWVHRNISDSPIFRGWDEQIPAEITINLHFDRKRRYRQLANATGDGPLEMDGYLEWGAALGNWRTDAYLGTMIAAGYNLRTSYPHPRVQLGSYTHELFRDADGSGGDWTVAGFSGVRGTAVVHDITLDGPWFRKFDGVSSRPFVAEWIVGASVRYRSWTVAWSRTFRSREFRGQQDRHQFASIQIARGF